MGQAASELQHVANQLQGMGPDEKKFIQAVFEGKVEEAKAALLENPNVIFARTRDWYNAWHLAARAGNMEMLDMLGQHGKKGSATRKPIPGEPPPYSAKSKKGQTPLMLACEEGHTEAMLALLTHGADVLDIDSYGNTCVHYASYKGHTKILDLLLARADASGRGDKNKRYTDLRNEAGLMPLHFAVWAGRREAAVALVAAKCRLNATSHSDSLGLVTCNAGSTALHLAAMRGSIEMATFLLETWATMNAQPQRKKPVKDPRTLSDHYGFTPLQIAQNLFIPSARREGGSSQATATALLRLLDPITRIEAPQRDEAEFERTRASLRDESIRRRSNSSSARISMDHAAVAGGSGGGEEKDPLAMAAPRPARLSYEGGGESVKGGSGGAAGEGGWTRGSPEAAGGGGGGKDAAGASPGQSLRDELRARRRAEEEEEAAAARRAEEDHAVAARAAEERAAAAEQAGLPPPKYVCPITLSVMDDPVTACDGLNYERSALEMWLELGNEEFPGSGVRIASRDVTPNPALKAEIAKWRAFKL
ncbi:hypothetical protein PLESTB_001432200 [Pleodorina starrii]|uniref:U-box domain-containing protein n=1 Tax=Pleodorina starrii TaxID=330485 RepID=A0A9W6BV20_9CHLO|nr:hypothetical protein PLESTM_001391100 [Pleodorina starrii]GLC59006.1 hypothetical protein PLESTB_001432200 [Pleodorina starrii]GLC67644.1 hypothetical protein PLESTF_000586100 [Pleodorina starrii]